MGVESEIGCNGVYFLNDTIITYLATANTHIYSNSSNAFHAAISFKKWLKRVRVRERERERGNRG